MKKRVFAIIALMLAAFLATSMSSNAATPTATNAASTAQKTTIVFSPHPDDETLRLAGYINRAAAAGDKMILVAASDGEGTGVVKAWGANKYNLADLRAAEQTFAMRELTKNRNVQIIRMHQPDGKISATAVRDMAKKLNASNVRMICACDVTDIHPDHRAVAQGLKMASLSYAPHCSYDSRDDSRGGTKVSPSGSTKAAIEGYRAVGWTSVHSAFTALKADPTSRVKLC